MSVLPNKGLCSKKSFIILCYRSQEPALNSPYVGLLKGQLDYWFSKSKYSKGFYKFLEPCKHPLYRAGDSWSEELGCSRRIFNAAFDHIGIRYNSKTAFMNAQDKFQGKLYASYYDRKTNRTFFVSNHEKSQQIREDLLPKKSSTKSLNDQNDHIKGKSENQSGDLLPSNRSRNDTNSRSCASNSGGTIGGENNTSEITSTSSLSPTSLSTTGDEKKKIANDMKNIWIEEIGELDVNHLTSTLISRLSISYRTVFKSSLENWRSYCRKIASSKFLMGEKTGANFKARLSWAIKPETYERIQAGDFTLGDRKIEEKPKNMSLEEEKNAHEELKQKLINSCKDQTWIEACLKLCEKKGHNVVKNWLYPLNIITINSQEVELEAPSRFIRDWVEKNLGKELKLTLQEILGCSLKYCRITSIA